MHGAMVTHVKVGVALSDYVSPTAMKGVKLHCGSILFNRGFTSKGKETHFHKSENIF